MLHVRLLQMIFTSGLLVVAVGIWMPRRVTLRRLLLVAAISWAAGVLAVCFSLLGRGPQWLAGERRNFSFSTQYRTSEEREHHKIVAPPLAERLPARFDRMTRPVRMAASFSLNVDGTVQDAHVTLPSGDTQLDTEVLASLSCWRFSSLPNYSMAAGTVSPAQEHVTVRISNNWCAVSDIERGVVFVAVAVVLWGIALKNAPRSQNAEAVVLVSRMILAAAYLGGIGWMLTFRIAADKGSDGLPVKQGIVYLVSLVIVAFVPKLLAKRRSAVRMPPVEVPTILGMAVSQGWGWAALGSILLFLTGLTPLGTTLGTEARLWLRLGPLQFQTIEAVKLMLVVFTARIAVTLCRTTRTLPGSLGDGLQVARMTGAGERVRGLLFGFLGVLLALAAMSDFGPALLIYLFLAIILYSIGQKGFSRACIVLLLVLLSLMYFAGQPARWRNRVEIWRDPWHQSVSDPAQRAEGRESVAESLWMFGSGGFSGMGLGMGLPCRVSAVESDFVPAALAEEIGLRGTALIFALLLYLPVSCLRLARTKRDAYERVFLLGSGTLLGVQSLMIIGGNLRVIPLSGVTLPFLSFGGTSLAINFLCIALAAGTAAGATPYPRELGADGVSDDRLRRISGGFRISFGLATVLLALYQLPFSPLCPVSRPFLCADGSIKRNPRLSPERLFPTVPGSLSDRSGVLLARQTPQGYRYADLASVELSRWEACLRETLRGTPPPESGIPASHTMISARRGNEIRLSIDSELQTLAASLLEAKKYTGSIVCLEPETGEILCAVSRSDRNASVSEWYRRGYAPGSTFKTITAAAGFEGGILSPATMLICVGKYEGISDFGGDVHGSLTLSQAMALSCNSVFAQAAERVGWEQIRTYGDERAGFGRVFSLFPTSLRGVSHDWPASVPSVVTGAAAESPRNLALTGIGQLNVHMTPLHLAVWAATIGNGGVLVAPTLLHDVRDSNGRVVLRQKADMSIRALTPENDIRLRAMMESVVAGRGGTGRAARVPRIRVAGKTGTAQTTPGHPDNALFIGFAPAEHPKIAFAIVIEGGKTGGTTAAPLTIPLIRSALKIRP